MISKDEEIPPEGYTQESFKILALSKQLKLTRKELEYYVNKCKKLEEQVQNLIVLKPVDQ